MENEFEGTSALRYICPHGTCLLQHVNLGACRHGDIERAFVNGMSELCALHPTTGVGESGEYLDPSTDKQVGLGPRTRKPLTEVPSKVR